MIRGGRIGIIGGGIGGLAAGVALHRAGFEIAVFERAADRRREGVALLIWANAMRAIDALGLLEAVRAIGAVIERTEIRRQDGEVMCDLPIGAWSEARRYPTVALRRPELIEILARALPAGALHVGVALRGFEQDERGVTAWFDDGREERFDALIGADGLGSTVRDQLFGPAPPRRLDQDAWVAVVHDVEDLVEAGRTLATIGGGPRFWSAPLTGGAGFWYATVNRGGAPPAETFASWHAPIPALIARTRPEDVVHVHIADRPPSAVWGRGRVTLLGDAAHPSTPDLGQGGCQALESAAVLAACLGRGEAIAPALRAYEAQRRDRTASIAHLCWLIATSSTAERPLLQAARDLAIRVGLAPVARRHLGWILEPPPW